MCSLATEMTSNWLMVDHWETHQTRYQPTAVVLDHFEQQINQVLGGIETSSGQCWRLFATVSTSPRLPAFSTPELLADRIFA
jgi:nicotinamide mononucleotide adenylyltransferase